MRGKKVTALVVSVLFLALLVAATYSCINNQVKETQTTAQPYSVLSETPSDGQAQVSVNVQYQGSDSPPSAYSPTPKHVNHYVKFYVTAKNLNDEGVLLGNLISSPSLTSNQGYTSAAVFCRK
jgi:hypothetical protein